MSICIKFEEREREKKSVYTRLEKKKKLGRD